MIKVMIFLRRKAGLTRAEFIDYYENHHAPLAQKLLPSVSKYVRNYIDHDSLTSPRRASGSDDSPKPYFDVVTELWFKDHEAYEAFETTLKNPDVVQTLTDDEARFIDLPMSQRVQVYEHVSDI